MKIALSLKMLKHHQNSSHRSRTSLVAPQVEVRALTKARVVPKVRQLE